MCSVPPGLELDGDVFWPIAMTKWLLTAVNVIDLQGGDVILHVVLLRGDRGRPPAQRKGVVRRGK
jgi:hypothetical protein